MKKFFTIFFVTLGVIFFLLILAATYFFVTDPLNLKPLLFGSSAAPTSRSEPVTAEDTHTESDDSMLDADAATAPAAPSENGLSPAQEAALETVGIDAASLPSEISPEQEACFTAILGAERVAEIKAGDAPTITEFYRARSCVE